MNQANKNMKQDQSGKEPLYCPLYSACEIQVSFVNTTGVPERNCPDSKTCYDVNVNTGCVAWQDADVCISYADAQVSSNAISMDHMLLYNNTKQTFYYTWQSNTETSVDTLRVSAIANTKKLRLEGKKQLINMIKGNLG